MYESVERTIGAAPAGRLSAARTGGARGYVAAGPAGRLAAAGALNQGAGVRAQAALGQALNRAPAVQRQAELGQALSRARACGTGEVVQRAGWSWATALAGAGIGAYYGSKLDSVLPYKMGTLLGGGLGGLVGYLAPSLFEQPETRPLWSEVNEDSRGYRSRSSPLTMADQLAASSPAFRGLRGRANDEVQRTLGRDLGYVSQGTGRHSAAYGSGDVRIDTTNHPAMSVQNLVFETANAAQTGFFERVRADAESGELNRTGLAAYGELLGRDPKELGELAKEYATGDTISRRAILQEWGEWNSLQLSRDALAQVKQNLTGETSSLYWDMGFGQVVDLPNFGEYYEERGEAHRGAVESGLRGKRKVQ